jgi:hypothetical protein
MRRTVRRSVTVALWAGAVAVGCSSAPTPPPRAAAAAPPPSAASRPAVAAAPARLVPPEAPGFRLKEAPGTYGPDNLYEFINGAADSFLAFDFQELTALTYVHTSKAEVSVEVYRHRDAERAFGVYAMERSASSTALPLGIEGHGGRDHLLFVVGPYYLKLALAGSADFALLRAVAEVFAAALPGTREPPPVLTCFPPGGRVLRGEKLAARDFLGRGFLHDAVAVPYEMGSTKFRLFVIRGRDEADARDMVARYEAVSTRRHARPAGVGGAVVQDPVNGTVVLWQRGRWVWGAVDNPPPAATPLLGIIGACLTRP